jgi:hypothetical protein
MAGTMSWRTRMVAGWLGRAALKRGAGFSPIGIQVGIPGSKTRLVCHCRVLHSRDAVVPCLALRSSHQVPHSAFRHQTRWLNEAFHNMIVALRTIEPDLPLLSHRLPKCGKEGHPLLWRKPASVIHVVTSTHALCIATMQGGRCSKKLDEGCLRGPPRPQVGQRARRLQEECHNLSSVGSSEVRLIPFQ